MVDNSLLPPPRDAARPFPWRWLLGFFVPAAALAGGTGLQRWFDSTAADPVLHWLAWSSGVGLLVGVVVGLVRRRRLSWMAYGLGAPWIAAGLVAAGIAVVRPVRESLADRREGDCRAEGRSICSVVEFHAACARRDLKLLGPPQQSIGRTQRWIYRGPFRPDQIKGAVICSIVDGTRSSTVALGDP